MSAGPGTEGLFCAHKKLRTTCAECRPPPPPRPPGVPEALQKDEEKPARAPRVKSRALPRALKATREEAENAVAWWVKKR